MKINTAIKSVAALTFFLLGAVVFVRAQEVVPALPTATLEQDSVLTQTKAYIGDDRTYYLYTDVVIKVKQNVQDSAYWAYCSVERANRKSTQVVVLPPVAIDSRLNISIRDADILPGMTYTYTPTFYTDSRLVFGKKGTPLTVTTHGRADEPYGRYNPPSNVRATVAVYRNKIKLTWEGTGGKYYAVYRTESLDQKMVPVYAWTTSKSFTDKDVKEGVRYYYAIKTAGENRAENGSEFSQWTYGQAGLTMPKDASTPVKVWNNAIIDIGAKSIVSSDFMPDVAPEKFVNKPTFQAQYYDFNDKLKKIALPAFKYSAGSDTQRFEFKKDIAVVNKKYIDHYYRIQKSVNLLLADQNVPDSIVLYTFFKMKVGDVKEQGQSRMLLGYMAPVIDSITPVYSADDSTPVLYNKTKEKVYPQVTGLYFGKKVKIWLEYQENNRVIKYALSAKNVKTQQDKNNKQTKQLTDPFTGVSSLTLKIPSKFSTKIPDSSPKSAFGTESGYTLVIQNAGFVTTKKVYLERDWSPSTAGK